MIKKIFENFQTIFKINPIRHDEEAGEIVKSRFQFVDLASGENSISASRQLSLLEHVLIALSSKQRDHVPYRQCKLTHSLQRALDQSQVRNCMNILINKVFILYFMNHL